MARLRTNATRDSRSQINCIAADAISELKATCVERKIWSNYVELGENAHKFGLHELSDKMFKAALHEFQAVQSPDCDLSQSVWNLAKIYVGQQKYKKAERLLKEKLETSETLLGKHNFRICVDIDRLATFYSLQGEYAKAEYLYRRALLIARRHFGSRDIRLIDRLRELASIYAVQGKDEKAQSTLRLALNLQTDTIKDFCDKGDPTPNGVTKVENASVHNFYPNFPQDAKTMQEMEKK